MRALIVEDQKSIRLGLKLQLKKSDDIIEIHEAKDGKEAIKMLKKQTYDILCIDLEMPVIDGMGLLEFIKAKNLDVVTIIITSEISYAQTVKSFNMRVQGIVLKQDLFKVGINEIISMTLRGYQIYSDSVFNNVDIVSMKRKIIEPGFLNNELSKRELEIAILLLNDLNNKEISEKLGLSIRTIETYRNKIMDKLNTKSLISLYKFGLEQGLIHY